MHRTQIESLFRRAVVLLVLSVAATAQAAEYRVVRQFNVAGEGGWDYLTYDTEGRRLFIARGDRVQVVTPKDGRLVGEVTGLSGVHGVALVPKHGKGYASSGRSDSIVAFDLKTLAVKATIATPEGRNPDFILYDARVDRVVAFNGRSNNASVIDVVHDRLEKTIALSGKPESAVADGRGRAYVAIEDRNEIAVLDLAKGVVAATFALPGCDEPAGLAIDPRSRRLFVGCHNSTMLVVAADGGKVVAKLPIGEGVDATTFDPGTNLAFSAQGDGTITVVEEATADRFAVVQTVTTARGARTMALDPIDHEVFVVTAEFDEQPAAEGQTRPRRTMRPATFKVHVVSSR